MPRAFIVSCDEFVDPPDWSKSTLPRHEERFARLGIPYEILTVAPLSHGWNNPLPPNSYSCGSGPLEALAHAFDMISQGNTKAVVIRGEDRVKTGYSRDERHRLMAIYGDSITIPDAYSILTDHFLKANNLSQDQFKLLAQALFENYTQTHSQTNTCNARLPEGKWFECISGPMRGVDCANPLIDYKGQVVLLGSEIIDELGYSPQAEVLGAGLGICEPDGPENAANIAKFDHLGFAIASLELNTGLDLVRLALGGDCLMEVYTCYPVVPLAFLIKSGFANNFNNLIELIKSTPLTVTGGMNLARAPWNLPALRGIIALVDKMGATGKNYGIIHGNGGLGYRQGVALLKNEARINSN